MATGTAAEPALEELASAAPFSLTVAPARSPSSVSVAGPSLVTVTVAHLSFAAFVSTATVDTSVSERVSVLVALGVAPGVHVSESAIAGVGPSTAPVWCSSFCSGSGSPPELALTEASCPAPLLRAPSPLIQ